MTFTIYGAPRTKKNSMRVVQVRGRPRLLPSKACDDWTDAAVLQLRGQFRRQAGPGGQTVANGIGPVRCPVNMRAVVYRDSARRADLLNYLAAVSDALEAAGIVENDAQIVAVDGSRLRVDRHAPRVEITLTPMVTP